jgi:plastocyanin
MKRLVVFIGVILLTSATIIGAAFATGYLHSTPQQTATPIHMVSLLDDKAEPDAVLVKQGEFVQFNSRDGKSHHLSPGRGNGSSDGHEHTGMGIESGVFGPDEGYRVQFIKTGRYEFHDHNNPDTYITVIVYNPTAVKK